MNSNLRWYKSSYSSSAGGECLEVAVRSGADEVIHIRDSKHPTGPILTLSPEAWASFTSVAKVTAKRR